MTGMLPVVEQLQDCETDAERARWLLSVPVVVLYREQTTIFRVLRSARFARGERLMNAEISALLATRNSYGRIPVEMEAMVCAERAFLEVLARKGGAE